jgi:hypothetical protein
MSNYIITDASGNQTNLSNLYNVYISGPYAVDTDYKVNGNDISTIYNQLGNRSYLQYPYPINYKFDDNGNVLNGRFEIKTIFSNPSSYSMTPIFNSNFGQQGVLIRINASTTITFNVNVTGIKFVIAGGGGGGGGTGNNYSSQRNNAGGGGAGEVLERTSTGTFTQISVVIGNGGAGGAKGLTNVSEGQPGGKGGTTTVTFGLTTFGALGGGGGASGKGYSTDTSSSGGSGGGGGGYSNDGGFPGFAQRYSGNTSSNSYVFPGGRGDKQSGDLASGGGGGGGAQAGFPGSSGGGGAGGAGHVTNTLGTTIITLGGGGGGGGVESTLELGGPGGSGGGGTGGGQGGPPNYILVQPSAGVANTGSGGGGGMNVKDTSSLADTYSQNGATGGSGVCYLLITNSMLS